MASNANPDLRIASIASMIVELAETVSPQGQDTRRLTYQSTLFPDPATEWEKTISL
jgi:hypothetical protein